MKKKLFLSLLIILIVVAIDQIVKIWVKTSFYYGEEVMITSWFRLLFIENNGMAFGMEYINKLVLTLFRVIMSGVCIYYIVRLCKNQKMPFGYIVCISLITAGAIGNAIDCVFYGVIFNNPSFPQIATMFPPDGGYAPLFYGKVVDMLYFPLFEWNWPEWLPYIGGEHYLFFQPIFNIADASLCVGVFVLIIFYAKYLSANPTANNSEANNNSDLAQHE